MIRMVHWGYISLILSFWEQTISTCVGSYPNLCDYNWNDNTTEVIDDFVENICDCQEVTFCFVIELTQGCNSTTINLSSKGNLTLVGQFQCDISPLEFQARSPSFKLLPKTDDEIIVEILNDSNGGKHKIICAVILVSNELNITNGNEWEIASVDPTEVLVHSELELQLTIIKQTEISQPSPWCFLLTPDNNIEIMSTSWMSDRKVFCSKFNPVVPGIFTVSLGSVFTSTIFDKGISIKVVSKHPVALEAEYSFNYDSIFIYFDENVEFRATCANAFPKEYSKYFGTDFNCYTKGNIFIVKMGAQFKLVDSVVINPDNKICLAGSQGSEFCLPALPLSLRISKPKVLNPNFSLYVDSTCGGNVTQNNVYIKVLPSNSVNLAIQNEAFDKKGSGKSQRRNLMIWRLMRQFQSKISSPVSLQMNTTDVLPPLENLSLLYNTLNVNSRKVVSPVASVSVFVQSSPTTSFIVAEANVTFCEGSVKLFRYNWYINEKNIFEDGKLITVEDLSPGKYVVKCVITAHNSSDILGEGWTTTEVLVNDERVLIVPSEITVGKADDIFLRAVTRRKSSISWTCRKNLDELCFTTNKKLVSDVLKLNSPNISIPGGTLPVGKYIWTIRNSRGLNRAKVFITPRNVTTVDVEISSALVRPSQAVVLRGIVRKVEQNCRAWWSSVRHKGFSYFNLKTVERLEENAVTTQDSIEEVLLEVPSSENQKKLESDAFYMFKFQVFCPYSSKNPEGFLDYIIIPLEVRNAPRVSPLIVEPLEGKAMITNFVISGAHADISVEDKPLLFEWSYVDPCDAVIPLKRGAFSQNFTTFLPPGDLKLIVKVCNGKEICSIMSSPVIKVLQALEFPTENFYKTRHRIQYLMTIGDTLEAFGVAVTVFKSLVLIVEPGVREDIFSTVEEGIRIRINDLAMRMLADSKVAKLSLDFVEQAVKVAEYFRKDSDIMNLLTEFNNSISKRLSSKEIAGFDEK